MEEPKNNSKVIIPQESLQPQRISRGEKAYCSVDDIRTRLQKNDATNIAVTGPYGSGKSSVLYTLRQDCLQYEYLNISLATLPSLEDNEEKQPKQKAGDDEGVSRQNLDRLIEYSILQQLIYREKQEALPDSRLKRIFYLPKKKVGKLSVCTILAFAALIVLFEPAFIRIDWLCELFGRKWLNIAGDLLSIIYLMGFTFKVLGAVIPALSYSRLNKVNLKNGEIEIVKNTSIFNKHLDEILYFFEKTKYDVVILEDLDRFGTTDIFLKLRELNLLLNESKVIDRKIAFIYAVRDDLFKDEDRVKCFDYIVTVIPVINPSNAKSLLKEELEKRGVSDIKEQTIRDLGFFLRDMRLLKNIANEYVQYRDRLEKGISSDKLLSMIVYKNYYPQDFAELHECDGVLYKFLSLKEKFVADRMKDIEAENAKRHEQQIAYQKNRHLKEAELRRLYVEAYRDKLGSAAQSIMIEENFFPFNDVAKDEKLFDKLTANPSISYRYFDTRNGYMGRMLQNTLQLPFSELEKEVDNTMSYAERRDALRASFNSIGDALFPVIRKEELRSQPLYQVLSEIDYAHKSEFIELKVPKLIEYLVVRGYIDEDYYDYISYFYDNFIDNHDWGFVLDVKLGNGHVFDYPVHKVEACLEELPNTVYRKTAILNIDIVNFLAANQNNRLYAARLFVIIKLVVEEKKFDFLIDYMQKGTQQDVVFKLLFGQFKELWPEIENYGNQENILKIIWFKYGEMDSSCKESREWLSKHYGFITQHLLDIPEDQWVALIQKNEYSFEVLDNLSGAILKIVVERNAYVLSRENVEILVSYLLDANCESLSYRIIRETKQEQLISRVENQLGDCLRSVFSEPESVKETKEAIVGILSSANVSEADKRAYLGKQENKIDLTGIESGELKTHALNSGVVDPSWENVIHYMNSVSDKVADEALTTFIDSNAEALANRIVPVENLEDANMLFSQFIASNVLSFDAYERVLQCFDKWYCDAGVPTVEEKRMLLLISRGMIHFSQKNTESLSDGYSASVMVAYLVKNKKAFLKAPESVPYSTEVAIGLMKTGLDVKEKAIILPFFDKELLNEKLSDVIVSELSLSKAKLGVDFLLEAMSLSGRIKEKIIVVSRVLEEYPVREAMITSFLETLPGKYREIAEKRKKPELPNDEITLRLVKLLKEKGYISSYSITKKGLRVYTRLK